MKICGEACYGGPANAGRALPGFRYLAHPLRGRCTPFLILPSLRSAAASAAPTPLRAHLPFPSHRNADTCCAPWKGLQGASPRRCRHEVMLGAPAFGALARIAPRATASVRAFRPWFASV